MRVPVPARTLFYEENIGRFAWAAKRTSCEIPEVKGLDIGPTKTLAGWHGRDWTYNRAFVDGHAESQKIYIEGTKNSEGYALHYKVEVLSHYPPFFPECDRGGKSDDSSGGASSDLAPVYHCVIIRGRGWQKDTLPECLFSVRDR